MEPVHEMTYRTMLRPPSATGPDWLNRSVSVAEGRIGVAVEYCVFRVV